MNFPFWFSKKIRLNAGGSGANSTGISIGVAGVALAVFIMECTFAIVIGFKNQITERIMGFEGEISVLPAYDYNTGQSEPYIEYTSELKDDIANIIPNGNAVLKFHQPGIFKTPTDFAGIFMVGYGDGYDYIFEKGNIEEGILPDYSNSENDNKIVISRNLANKLNLNVNEKIDACFFINDAIKSRRFEIAGIYNTGFSDFDNTIAFTSIATLQKIAKTASNEGTSLSINLPKNADIEGLAYNLQNDFVNKYQKGDRLNLYPVDNVKHTGAIFFNWLNLLDTNVVVILILMACVAGFTLISSMFIIILDHIPTIGLLRALGSTSSQIRIIFTNMSMKIVLWGLIAGNILGIGTLLVQDHYKIMKLNPEMYYLPYVPVDISWSTIAILNACVILIAWGLLVIPSKAAAKISPAETLNFE